MNHMHIMQQYKSASASTTSTNNNNNSKLDLVEPPKFITGRHVAAVFEKLGYDPLAGECFLCFRDGLFMLCCVVCCAFKLICVLCMMFVCDV
jgi:hypothetical protein